MIQNKIRNYISAAKFNKPQLYFHGTSTNFLRSILKHGLDPKLTNKGLWAEEETNYQPSRKSLPGIYFAKSAYTAKIHAANLCRKIGGKIVIVCTELQEKSSLPDEDNFGTINRMELIKGLMPLNENSYYLAIIYVDLILAKDPIDSNYFKTYYNYILLMYPHTIQSPKFQQIVYDLMLAEIRRLLCFYKSQDKYNSVNWDMVKHINLKEKTNYTIDDLPEKYQSIIEATNNQSAAEKARRVALDRFLHTMRNYKHEDTWLGAKTLRINQRIGFSGANKIICILFIQEGNVYNGMHDTEKNPDPITYINVIYGIIPNAFLTEYLERTGVNHDKLKINLKWSGAY